jgi:hypothetical protein
MLSGVGEIMFEVGEIKISAGEIRAKSIGRPEFLLLV